MADDTVMHRPLGSTEAAGSPVLVNGDKIGGLSDVASEVSSSNNAFEALGDDAGNTLSLCNNGKRTEAGRMIVIEMRSDPDASCEEGDGAECHSQGSGDCCGLGLSSEIGPVEMEAVGLLALCGPGGGLEILQESILFLPLVDGDAESFSDLGNGSKELIGGPLLLAGASGEGSPVKAAVGLEIERVGVKIVRSVGFEDARIYQDDGSDPPNWQQQQLQPADQGVIGNHENQRLLEPPSLAAPVLAQVGVGVGSGSTIRPTSMAERARVAKVPRPEAPLKCPRCQSSNTKFCYFNNYSLSQPRHFCKTCRRYWTRGGALRNVPVGGGCRRNNGKSRSKNIPRPKSPVITASCTATTTTCSNQQLQVTGSITTDHLQRGAIDSLASARHFLLQQPAADHHANSQFSYLATLQNLTRFGMGNLGLGSFERSFDHTQTQPGDNHFGAPAGSNAQELPFFGLGGTLEAIPSAAAGNLVSRPYDPNFHNGGAAVAPSYHHGMMGRRPTSADSSGDHHQAVLSQLQQGEVKIMEQNDGPVGNIDKQLMGMPLPGHNQFWAAAAAAAAAADEGTNSGNAWTDLSGITSAADGW
ncbi:hypothetical protein Dimus_009112 [Dionaea muscipula]